MTAAPSPAEQAAVDERAIILRVLGAQIATIHPERADALIRELRAAVEAARAPLERELAELHDIAMDISTDRGRIAAKLFATEQDLAAVRKDHEEWQTAWKETVTAGAVELAKATQERDEARRKLDRVAAEWKEMSAALDAANASLRLVEVDPSGVWRWQGDGHDHPDSLSCPVVMSADTLRGFVAARDELARVRADFETERAAWLRFLKEERDGAVARERETIRDELRTVANRRADGDPQKAGLFRAVDLLNDRIRILEEKAVRVVSHCLSRWNAYECERPVGHRGDHGDVEGYTTWPDSADTRPTIDATPTDPTRRPLPAGWGWVEGYMGAGDDDRLVGPGHDGKHPIARVERHGKCKWWIWDGALDSSGRYAIPIAFGFPNGDTGAERLTAAQHAVEDEAWARGLFGEVG